MDHIDIKMNSFGNKCFQKIKTKSVDIKKLEKYAFQTKCRPYTDLYIQNKDHIHQLFKSPGQSIFLLQCLSPHIAKRSFAQRSVALRSEAQLCVPKRAQLCVAKRTEAQRSLAYRCVAYRCVAQESAAQQSVKQGSKA